MGEGQVATEIEGKNKRKGKGKRGKLCLTKGKIRNRCMCRAYGFNS